MKKLLQTSAFFLSAILLSAVFGLLIPILNTKYSLAMLAGFIGVAALFINTEIILLGLLALTLCVVGPLNYFGVVNLHWIPYIIGALLYVKLILEKFGLSTNKNVSSVFSNSMSGFQWAVLIFFAILALSTALSPPVSQLFLISSRNYYLLWSVYLLLALGHVRPEFFKNAWSILIGVALLQLPFTLFQNLVIARNRHDNASWDAVIGTFFGYKDAGGDSGGMAIFLLTVIAVALSLARRHLLSGKALALIGIVTLASLLLAEVKIIYILLPIVFVGVFRSEVLRNALLALFGGGVIALVFATVFFVYNMESPGAVPASQKSFTEKFDEIFKYSTASDAYLYRGGVGRTTALAIWWNGNEWSDPNMYIGNGMGSSAISQRYGEKGGKIGERYYPLEIDTTAASVLLWETGVFGTIAFTSVLVLAAIYARRIARSNLIPAWNSAVLDATPAVLSMYIVSLLYHKNAIGGSTAGQLLLLFFLGHVGYWAKRIRSIG